MTLLSFYFPCILVTTFHISPAFAVVPLLISCSLSCWYIFCLSLSVLFCNLIVYLEDLLPFFFAQVLLISSQIKIKLKPQGKNKEIECTSLAEGLFCLSAQNARALQALSLTFGVLLISSWCLCQSQLLRSILPLLLCRVFSLLLKMPTAGIIFRLLL